MNRYLIIALMILMLPISQPFSQSHASLDKAGILEHQSLIDLSHTQNSQTDKIALFKVFIAIVVISLILRLVIVSQIPSVIRKFLFTPIFYQSNYLVYSPLSCKAL